MAKTIKKEKKSMKLNVIKNFFICSFGALLLRSMTAISAPFVMRYISPEEYGLWGLVISFINILTPLTGFGLRQVLSLEYFHANKHAQQQKINEIITIYVILALPIFCTLFYFRNLINHYVFLDRISTLFIAAGLCMAFMYFFAELFYQILRYEQKAKQLTLLQLCIALINFGLILWLVSTYKNIKGIVIAQCCTLLLTIGIGIFAYLHKKYHHALHIKKHLYATKHYLIYGLPFIPSMLFAWLLSSGDRWILAHLSSLHTVGLYSTADMFVHMFQFLVLYPWSSSYLPYILNRYAQNKHTLCAIEKENHKAMYFSMIIVSTLIGIGFFIGTPILHLILPKQYHAAISYIWILLFGQVFLLGSYFASSLMQFHKKRYFIAFGLCIPAVLNIFLNIILIPHFGLYGCTSATLIAYAFYFCITLWYNKHVQKHIVIQNNINATPASIHKAHATSDTTKPPQIIPTRSTNTKPPSTDYVDKSF